MEVISLQDSLLESPHLAQSVRIDLSKLHKLAHATKDLLVLMLKPAWIGSIGTVSRKSRRLRRRLRRGRSLFVSVMISLLRVLLLTLPTAPW